MEANPVRAFIQKARGMRLAAASDKGNSALLGVALSAGTNMASVATDKSAGMIASAKTRRKLSELANIRPMAASGPRSVSARLL